MQPLFFATICQYFILHPNMRQIITLLLFMACSIGASAQQEATTTTQQTTPLLSPRAFASNKHVSVSYGQPSKRNRVIFGELVPYGQVWRTGANEATEITFRTKMKIAGVPVDTGTYTFFTIPGEKEWTIILNKQLGQWGAYEYDKHKDKDVVKVNVPVLPMKKVQEKLVYEVSRKALTIKWDKTSVNIPLIINQ